MEQLFLTILNRAVTAGWLVLLVMVLRVVLKKSAPGGALWPVGHCGGAAAVAGGPAAPGRRQPGAHHGAYLRRRADGGGNSGIRRASRRWQSRRCGGSGDGGPDGAEPGPHRRGGVACGHGGHGAVSGRQLCAAAGAAADGGAAGGRRVGKRAGPVSLCAGVYPAPHLSALRPGPGKPGLCAGP